MAKHLKFGFVCLKDLVQESCGLLRCSIAKTSCADMLFSPGNPSILMHFFFLSFFFFFYCHR